KVTEAKFVTNFRPIILIGCVYKVVTKIIANRLATVISDLVYDIQSTFVANRQILDGPFILNELLAWLKQGDPLAPYLFILIMESLHISFSRATSDGLFKGLFIFPFLELLVMVFSKAASLIGCAVMQNPFRYLGVMVGDSMSQKLAWADTIQKLRSRLSKWKVKTLSIGGRLTLLKFVFGASPLYNMSIYKVPKGVLKEMEAIRCNFFNGVDPAERKITWVSWDKVLASKKMAFLEFQSLIWCSILREIQVLISKGFEFVSHCKKHVGDGHNIQFWYDSWVFDQPLRVRFPRLFAFKTDKESTVTSKWICYLNGDGVFRVKEVRTILDDIFLPSAADATRWVKYIPIKINVFAWRARLHRLPTRGNLVRRGVVLDSSLCPLFGLVPGDIHHVLFRCDMAKLVFRRICRWWDLDWHDLLSFSDWNAWFSAIWLSYRIKLILEGVFYVAWWHLWVYRNQSIFTATPPRRSVIFDDIVSYSFTWCTSRLTVQVFESKSETGLGVFTSLVPVVILGLTMKIPVA
nr:RNA-directed DNA polymerase, eukaryota [Tanacetum cinerariifolium]